jgi:ATP-dependent DNA ligase
MQKKINLMKPKEMRDDRRGAGPELVLGRAVISDFSNSRVLERLLMYERRIENSLNKTMDELHKRKLVQQLEQANKAIETDEFATMDHPQASLGAATLSTEDGSQMAEDRKYTKQSQFVMTGSDISSFTKADYGNIPCQASDENKANPALSSTKPGQVS